MSSDMSLAPLALLVEDEPHIRRFVRAALEEEGWLVHEAATAQRGRADAGTRSPDLIILDLGLPDGDGIDLIGDIRKWSAVPIIVLSARTGEGDKITALDASRSASANCRRGCAPPSAAAGLPTAPAPARCNSATSRSI